MHKPPLQPLKLFFTKLKQAAAVFAVFAFFAAFSPKAIATDAAPPPALPPEVALAESPFVPDSHPKAFRPGRWSEGFHLLTGFGLNASVLNSETAHINAGLGSNFKADIGWYLNDRLALEVGSAVKFNRFESYLLWDTLFTLGIRYRFRSPLFKTEGSFVRLFAGDSPTVIYLGDSDNPLKAIGASRAQINGPLAGFGAGTFFKTQAGLNWFIEWDAAYQWLRFSDAIVDKNDVPVVLQSSEVGGQPKIFSFALSIGLVLF
jgi:hypothetical protein